MEETYKVTWLCRSNRKIKSFVFDGFVDDKQNNRIIFTNDNTDHVMTISNDSYYWMLTRPNTYDLNDN